MKRFLTLVVFLSVIFRVSCQNQFTIPVVFHILYETGPENIGDSQVYSGMTQLNEDFNKQNADTAEVIVPFIPLIADVGIHFQLANLDPNGNPTSGIDRIQTPLTDSGGFQSFINQWPPQHYLNIWTIGYSTNYPTETVFPATADSFPNEDGIELLNSLVGTIGTSSGSQYHALTHQAGHYLNLLHTFGRTNTPGVVCGDDSVADTPLTKGWIYCPDSTNAAVCDSVIIENYQNFMDYSFCWCMFTPGQKTRMVNCLTGNVAHRDSLFTLENLIRTGIVTTGINENHLENLTAFPNPFGNAIQLRGLPPGDYAFSVEDMLGRTIVAKKSIQVRPAEPFNLDLTEMETNGVYLLKVSDGQTTGTFKIVKQ